MGSKKLTRKWGYIFMSIAIAALATCIISAVYKEYIISIATGVVFVAQMINFIQWKKQR